MVPNPTSALTLPVTINLVDTAWLRALTAQPAAHINVTFAYVPTGAKTALRSVLMAHALSWVYWVMGPSMSYCWAFCQYCTFPLAERLSGARDVQLMTGLSGFDYISAHFLFDFIYHVLFTVSWCGLHYGLSSYSLTTAGTCAHSADSFETSTSRSPYGDDADIAHFHFCTDSPPLTLAYL
ncbi:hypothetical protein HPB49_016483 [Dermacentor silvarum]|uniref:Uncharacterized protein n=1 Tax=Dermacentor silvarum TaxID=543639 RepID=A0ACB8DJ68_DERSI|nr:hypothetical protein HPB49_016483 [Dermacentor silvarum]